MRTFDAALSSNRIETLLLWLVSFSSTLGVLSVGMVGDTLIPPAPILAVLYVAYGVFKGRGRLRFTRTRSGRLLMAYVLYCCLTVLLPCTVGLADHVDLVLKGLLVLTSQVVLYLTVIMNPSASRAPCVLSGLLVGAAINAVYGIYQYIGSFHDLPAVTPPSPIPIADPVILHRAQGLQAEPSYLAALLVPAVLLWIGMPKRKARTWLWGPVLLIGLVVSFSSGVLVLPLAIGVYAFLKLTSITGSPMRLNRLLLNSIVVVLLVVILTGALLLVAPEYYLDRLAVVLDGFMPTAYQNAERWDTIKLALNEALVHPLGVGYNVGPFYLERIAASPYGARLHSLFARLMLEVGFVGTLLFCTFVLWPTWRILRRNKQSAAQAVALSSVASLLYSFLTSNNLFTFQWVLWGLSALLACQEETYGAKRVIGS